MGKWDAIRTYTSPTTGNQIQDVAELRNDAGLYIRAAQGQWTSGTFLSYTEPGDRMEFDIFVCNDSKKTSNFFFTTSLALAPVISKTYGVDQNGKMVYSMSRTPGKWYHHVVGVGTTCPLMSLYSYIALCGIGAGYYHFYLDNMIVRKSDGSIRTMIWQSKEDFTHLIYRFNGVSYTSFADAKSANGFPFDSISVTALNIGASSKAIKATEDPMLKVLQTPSHISVYTLSGNKCLTLESNSPTGFDPAFNALQPGLYILKNSDGTIIGRTMKIFKGDLYPISVLK